MHRLSVHGIIAVITGGAFLIRKSKKQILRALLGRMLTYKQLTGGHLSKPALRWATSVYGHRRRKEEPEPVKNRGLEPFFYTRQARVSLAFTNQLCDFGLVAACFHGGQTGKMTIPAHRVIVTVTWDNA